MTRQFVLGTAGHIDHGKTALTKALTGTDTDRLPEEKARGITIELGFAKLDIAGARVSIVDVPGHERFLRTMAAGAAGLDAALLCIAADDGVMPQTTEHLAICELLGVRSGCVVITKADAVEADLIELVEAEVEELVSGTCFEGRPIVVTSSKTGQGLDALKAVVAEMVSAAEGREDETQSLPVFLPVDRHFQKAGFGAVITGTLSAGTLREGDTVRVMPLADDSAGDATVRGIQVHGEATTEAHAPTRVAVNLRGVDAALLTRGAVVCPAGSPAPGPVLHAALTVLPSMSAVSENDEVSLHLGTTDTLARVVPLEGDVVEPGTTGMVRLLMHRPVYAVCAQRYIVRRPGGGSLCTIGGGHITDPFPPSFKGAYKTWGPAARAMREEPATAGLLALVVDTRYEGLRGSMLQRRLPPNVDVDAALTAHVEGGRVVELETSGDRRFYDAAIVKSMSVTLLAELDAWHAEHAIAFGPSVGDLASSLHPRARPIAGALVARLATRGDVALDGGKVARAGRERDPAADAAIAKAMRVLDDGGLTPPLLADWRSASGLNEQDFADALTELRRRDQVVVLSSQLTIAKAALEALVASVRAHFAEQDTLDTTTLKALGGGLSRKHAIPLLEWLDKSGVTRRQGDVRIRGR